MEYNTTHDQQRHDLATIVQARNRMSTTLLALKTAMCDRPLLLGPLPLTRTPLPAIETAHVGVCLGFVNDDERFSKLEPNPNFKSSKKSCVQITTDEVNNTTT